MMIVYNVQRRWFTMKNEADAYRRAEGLKPAALATLRVNSRDDLAALLNALCGIDALPALAALPEPVTTPEVVERALVSTAVQVLTPDFVPRFLIERDGA